MVLAQLYILSLLKDLLQKRERKEFFALHMTDSGRLGAGQVLPRGHSIKLLLEPLNPALVPMGGLR
jgi:hypothetical protein